MRLRGVVLTHIWRSATMALRSLAPRYKGLIEGLKRLILCEAACVTAAL
jgi:hypothetical protein